MKIKSVKKEFTEKDKVALVTSPANKPEVFAIFRDLMHHDPVCSGINVIAFTGGFIIQGVSEPISTQLVESINRILNNAEGAHKAAEEQRRKKTELERSEKQKAIDAASKAFGVPAE